MARLDTPSPPPSRRANPSPPPPCPTSYADKEEHARRIVALGHVLKRHFRNEVGRPPPAACRLPPAARRLPLAACRLPPAAPSP